MHAAFHLGLDIEILVFLAEKPEVHVETVHLRIRETLLHFHGLLDGSDAADLRTLLVAGLDVARSYAVYEAYLLDILSGDPLVISGV